MVLTIKEVAEKANVGISTISRVVNNYPYVNEKTRERVLKVIKKTNYRTNMLGRRLRIKRTSTIGVCISGDLISERFGYSYSFVEILRGIRAVSGENFEYDILLQVPKGNQDRNDYIRLFNEQKVDGAIIVFPSLDDPGLKDLEEKKVPVVLINREYGKLNYVKVDNVNSTFKIMEHLVELGHKRIGIITQSLTTVAFKERFDAYKSVLAKYNFPYIEKLVVHIPGNEETTSYNAMKELLIYKPDAVYTTDDFLAVGAIKAIQEAGLRIPEDIAVVGFDDDPVASFTVPPLTTIRQPFFEIGRESADILIRRIEGKSGEQLKKILPGKLIVRSSSMNGGK